jgi:hypothetical protein
MVDDACSHFGFMTVGAFLYITTFVRGREGNDPVQRMAKQAILASFQRMGYPEALGYIFISG